MTTVRNKRILKQFGSHLKGVRISRNLTLEELAYEADTPISQIGRIERGEVNPSLSTLYAIARALGTSLSDLMKF